MSSNVYGGCDAVIPKEQRDMVRGDERVTSVLDGANGTMVAKSNQAVDKRGFLWPCYELVRWCVGPHLMANSSKDWPGDFGVRGIPHMILRNTFGW